MEPAQATMKTVFEESGFTPQKLICPIIPNTTAQPHAEPGLVFPLLIEQITAPVRWKQTVQTLLELGQTHALEIGPGKVLTGLAKRITHPKLKNSISVIPISEAESFKEIQA
jgi:[acyl-carrier-protein] S-malonyltransferase